MFLLLFFSSVFCLVRNSWLVIWVILELNTLSFCSLLKFNSKQDRQSINEIAIKYLLIQIIASRILLISTSWSNYLSIRVTLIFFIAVIAIIIKAASAPFHQWFINVTKNSKWSRNSVLLTWQKMAPLYLILFQIKVILIFFVLSSTIIGAVSLINKKKLKEILAYSSVFNLSWIVIAVIIRTKLFILFSFIYWISVLIVIYSIIKNKMRRIEETTKKTEKWLFLLLIANLAGIPPLIGFIAKWMVFTTSLGLLFLTLISFMLIIRTLNFYVYLRSIRSHIIKGTSNQQKEKLWESQIMLISFILINIILIYRVCL